MNDVLTIVWKELKELWNVRASGRGRALNYIPILLVFGVLLPLQQRDLWVYGPVAGVFIMILPVILAGGVVADSFAGERERHTLETLLASRLSDRDIYLGKVVACVAYCLALAWVSALVSLVTLNVTRGAAPLFFFGADALALSVIGGVLLCVMTAGIGVFVSLRAPTVRAAAQVFSLATVLIFVGGPFLLRALPSSAWSWISGTLDQTEPLMLGVAGAAAILVVDVLLLTTGIARFQRRRLILE